MLIATCLSYKMYVRPHLDYGDVIYHNQRADLMDFVERVQYKAALIVSGCWQGTSREKLYEELGWESLSDRRWLHRLTIFYKMLIDLPLITYLITFINAMRLIWSYEIDPMIFPLLEPIGM